MSYNVFITEFRNGKEISNNHIGTTKQSEVIERLFGLPARSYADNDKTHDAIQTDKFKQNWLKLQAWSLRQIQLHADELLTEFEDLDNNQAKMISELKAHADQFTVGDVKKYNERLTDFLQCPLANSEIVLGNSELDASEVALILDFVGDLVRDPKNVEVSFG
jgi:acetyl-CoA carboxylase beta subunit